MGKDNAGPGNLASEMSPILIQDMSFREGNQSLFATRMRTEDMIPLAEAMDELGLWAVEIWGGATFDAMHRYLDEDPWERPRILRKYMRNTPFSAAIRGQNLLGYRNYADDVVEAFIDESCEVGVDIFKVLDALNDFRNLETCAKKIKENGKHFEGTICYSLNGRHIGGEVFTFDYYVQKSIELEKMGADTICIKDMGGISSPYDIYELIVRLKEKVSVPIHLHNHYTAGFGSMTCLKAIEAGVDIVDTCFAPFAIRNSLPAIEPLVAALEGTARDPNLDFDKILEISGHLESTVEKYREFHSERGFSVIDTNVLAHQIPGGMISNLASQLKEAGLEAHFSRNLVEVFKEVPATRRDLGNPPMVTPLSQIVGTQSVLNAAFGRYRIISNQVKELLLGGYGKTPSPVSQSLQSKICAQSPERTIIEGRPADQLAPEMEKAGRKIGSLARTRQDLLLYTLFPITGKEFLMRKYNGSNDLDAMDGSVSLTGECLEAS